MNLADIRKKANRERGAEPAAASGTRTTSPPDRGEKQPLPNQQVEQQALHEEQPAISPPPTTPEPPPELPVRNVPESVAVPAAPEPPVIAAPGLAAARAVEFAATPSVGGATAPPAGRDMKPVSIPVGDRGPLDSFDPLALLLAGRAAAGFDEEATIALPEEAEPEKADYHEFLCFRVASEEYAINIMEIKEIIKPREITEVPRVPSFISGVLSLRGIIIPVFDMRKRLQLTAAEESAKERIIVVSKGEELFGMRVDEVLQVVRITEEAIEQPPAVLDGIDRDFVQGIGRHNNRMLILLDLPSILDISLW